ncbi:MAG: oxaloacetate decarboxylase, partial [Rhodospirillales bacterium]|nr:oxaloacetate decarboxylase [Rhodospirillales bacterium]
AALTDKAYLASQRVRIALQGHQPIAASMAAVHATLKQLREGVAPGKLTGVPTPDFMKRITRENDYAQWTREYLGNKP